MGTTAVNASQAPDAHIYCAGLPFVGERRLTAEEVSRLRRKGWRKTILGVLTPFVGVFGFLFLALLLGGVIGNLRAEFRDAGIMLLCLLVVGGIALSLLGGRDWRRTGWKFVRTQQIGYVRRFEGPLTLFDLSDVSLIYLVNSGTVDTDDAGDLVLELLPHLDELYSINDVEIKGEIKMAVTVAARRPANAQMWDMPSSWMEPIDDANLLRRHPTKDEIAELKLYARLGLRYWIRRTWQTVLYSLCIGYLLFAMIAKVFNQIEDLYKPEFSVLYVALAFAGVAVCIVFVLTGLTIYDDIKLSRSIRKDIEFGCIFAATFDDMTMERSHYDDNALFERFPISGLAWTVAGKPAAWRRYSVSATLKR